MLLSTVVYGLKAIWPVTLRGDSTYRLLQRLLRFVGGGGGVVLAVRVVLVVVVVFTLKTKAQGTEASEQATQRKESKAMSSMASLHPYSCISRQDPLYSIRYWASSVSAWSASGSGRKFTSVYM